MNENCRESLDSLLFAAIVKDIHRRCKIQTLTGWKSKWLVSPITDILFAPGKSRPSQAQRSAFRQSSSHLGLDRTRDRDPKWRIKHADINVDKASTVTIVDEHGRRNALMESASHEQEP